MELDSANSSDALLMNIFCHPQVFNGNTLAPAVANLLNVDPTVQPCFGINPGVPLKTIRKRRTTQKPQAGSGINSGAPCPASGTWVLEAATSHPLPPEATDQTLTDRTEIDLQLGNLFVEAKLTETGFQNAKPRLIERYRDLETVFDITRLPWTADGTVQGYQLIRNVLAAFASDASFCVLSDARRRDLIEVWYSVLSAVHYPSFAWRLKLLTWQELATALPKDLQQFLEAKYGIVPVHPKITSFQAHAKAYLPAHNSGSTSESPPHKSPASQSPPGTPAASSTAHPPPSPSDPVPCLPPR